MLSSAMISVEVFCVLMKTCGWSKSTHCQRQHHELPASHNSNEQSVVYAKRSS